MLNGFWEWRLVRLLRDLRRGRLWWQGWLLHRQWRWRLRWRLLHDLRRGFRWCGGQRFDGRLRRWLGLR